MEPLPGDVPRLTSFFDLVERDRKEASSSTVVAADEFDRDENLRRLPSPAVEVYVEERLIVDLVRRLLLTEPLKKSPMDDPGRELKRLRDMASRPKIDTLERAVGVDGREFLPVRNSKRPNW